MAARSLKIGVFDSGIGGLSVARAIEQALPEIEVSFKNDADHVPYGSREPAEILELILPIFQTFVDEKCQLVVVACNTVSMTLIKELRDRFDLPFITVEPQLDLAGMLTISNVVAVCATPTTLASERYDLLKQLYTEGLTVIEPDCSDWSTMIERGQVEARRITAIVDEVLAAGTDVIVLGCTHYHWIEQQIIDHAAGRAIIIHPEQQVVAQLKQVLGQLA
jgi:glutamate racemase